MKIAVIGSGVAGITASYILSKEHDVLLFESNEYLGGHTNTIPINSSEGVINVDTGFIVFNSLNYPLFSKLLSCLNVKTKASDMSFGFFTENHSFFYSSRGLRGLFAQKKNILNPQFYTLFLDIFHYHRAALKELKADRMKHKTLKEFIFQERFSKYFIERYLLPMGAAIWSCSYQEILDFPVQYFLQFWNNHHMLTVNQRPVWRVVDGGSFNYINAFKENFSGKIFLNTQLQSIKRFSNSVHCQDTHGNVHSVDAVVIATHANQILPLLQDPSPIETQLFSVWKYSQNKTVLHTDKRLMPKHPDAWASWNYMLSNVSTDQVSVTYHMNRLQSLECKKDYFVTLNPTEDINSNSIIKEITYSHPIYSFDSIETQQKIKELNGINRTYYCGSYLGYGFHEDAVSSAVQVADHFGLSL